MRAISIREGAALALDQLRANKTRSALTILGIVIGVAVVMAMSALIAGVRTSVITAFEAAGPANFSILRYDPLGSHSTHEQQWLRNPRFTLAEMRRIGGLSKLKGAVPYIPTQGEVSYRGHRLPSVTVTGRSAGWPGVDGGTLVAGRNFTPAEDRAAHRVAVITVQAATNLFGPVSPIGRQIRIGGQPFQVIGVFRLPDNIFASVQKHTVVTPYNAALKYLDAELDFVGIDASPAAGYSQDEAIDQVTVVLRSMRGLRPTEPNDFAIVKLEQFVSTFKKLSQVFWLVMTALSSVALMVGGVGVVAIMMIAVTERTREIGIRKALGATRREILWQFLMESVTVTFIGATIGMGIGAAGAFTVDALTPVPARVPLLALVAALAMAAIGGVLFGLWPAWRAARMDPVEALRYE